MATSPNLTRTEKRLFEAYWQDGILDLLAGVGLLAISLGWLLDAIWLAAVVPAPIVLLWPLLRRRITEPRLGLVRFAARRRHDMRHGWTAVLSLGLVLFGFSVPHLFRGGALYSPLEWLAPGLPSLMLSLMALSAFQVLRLSRLLLYASVLVGAGLASAALNLDPGWAMLLGGATIALTGTFLLARFLRDFPRLPQELD